MLLIIDVIDVIHQFCISSVNYYVIKNDLLTICENSKYMFL